MRTHPRLTAVTASAALATLTLVSGAAQATSSTHDDPRGHGRGLGLGLGSVVTDWNEAAGRAALAACIAPLDNPLHESRIYAMGHLAIHDALNAIDRRSTPYGADFRVKGHVSARAAVAEAARDAFLSAIADISAPFPQACRDAGAAVVEEHYTAQLALVPEGRAKALGRAAGARAAAAVVARRSNDGADTPLIVGDYPQGTRPGQWVFTSGTGFAFAPGWGSVKHFAAPHRVRVPGPFPVRSKAYARDLNEVKALGGDGVTTPSARTADQTQIALFWWESSPLAWNRIARQLAYNRHLDAWEQARLYGLLDVAMADGYVDSFATKYANPFWRPETAVRQADHDHNRATAGDPTWTPLVTTPPLPDHDSAHAVEGGAATAVFRSFFGTDRISFSNCSNTVPTGKCGSADEVRRQFRSFSQAARENADSRVYIGFHFRRATDVGLARGSGIGGWVAHSTLAPVR